MNKSIRKFFCFFGLHSYEAIKVHHYYDVSWGYRSPSTTITYRCKHCGKIKQNDHYGIGFLTLEEVRGEIKSVDK